MNRNNELCTTLAGQQSSLCKTLLLNRIDLEEATKEVFLVKQRET